MNPKTAVAIGVAVGVVAIAALCVAVYYICVQSGAAAGTATGQLRPPPLTYFIVNLKRRGDRKRAMEGEMASAGIDRYTFIEAVDGKTLQLTPTLARTFKGNDFGSRKAVMGCALSHYTLWQALAKDARAYSIIFEDDVNLCADFTRKVDRVLSQAGTYDVIFLSYTMSPDVKKAHSEYWALGAATGVDVRALDKKLCIGGTMAYYVTRQGVQKMLAYWDTHGMKYAIDSAMVFAMPELALGECCPFLASTQSEESGDTDIGRVWDAFDLGA